MVPKERIIFFLIHARKCIWILANYLSYCLILWELEFKLFSRRDLQISNNTGLKVPEGNGEGNKLLGCFIFSQKCYWRFSSSWMPSSFVRRAVLYSTKECNLSSSCPIFESFWAKRSRRWKKYSYYIRAVGNYLHSGTTEQRSGSESSVRTPLCPCQTSKIHSEFRALHRPNCPACYTIVCAQADYVR